jgi:ParB family transcriptional regulator, chromosome partitioning protein
LTAVWALGLCARPTSARPAAWRNRDRTCRASHPLGFEDSAAAKAVDERHRRWSAQLPRESADLWHALSAFDPDSRDALFAHCVALSVNAVYEPWNRRPWALAHADRIAESVGLDVAAAGWSPTVDNYLGRVTKARIVQAVRENQGRSRRSTH